MSSVINNMSTSASPGGSGTAAPVKMIGSLGKHGPYTFYRSIKTGDRTYSLSQFMPVKIWPESAMLNIANVQLLWSDKTESFCSLKLYFLPENTPDGRLQQHGEDEVIALHDKVTIRAADLSSILVEENEWDWGYKTPHVSIAPLNTVLSKSFASEQLSGERVNGTSYITGSSSIVVLNYPRYTRLRTTLKRLEGSPAIQRWLENPLVLALGALNVGPNCRVLYAKESFHHPDLEDNEIVCNHLAPKLKGKKGRKTRKRNDSRGSGSNESVSDSSGDGSYKENEKKSVNGIKLEHDDTSGPNRSLKESGRRPTSSSYTAKVRDHNNKQHLWNKSESNNSSQGKRSQRTNGLSSPGIGLALHQAVLDWDSKRKVQLLGPELTELAQKLERSNALQILPIRPTSSSDELGDNQTPRKRRKTEYPIPNPLLFGKTGPYDCKLNKVVGPPGDNRTKNLQGEANPTNSALIEAHSIPLQISKLTRIDLNWKPLTLSGASPSLYIPQLDTVCCDPYDAKRHAAFLQRGIELRPMDIMDLSGQGGGNKSSRSDKKTSQQGSRGDNNNTRSPSSVSSLTIKRNSNPDLLDLRPRLRSSSSSFQNSKASPTNSNQQDDSPSNHHHMGSGGVRLTSEVTLFPSKYLPSYPSALDGVMQHHFANPRHVALSNSSKNSAVHEIDIQPWNPLSSTVASATSSSGSSSRPSTTSAPLKEQVTAKKHTTKGAHDNRTSQSQSQTSSKQKGRSNLIDQHHHLQQQHDSHNAADSPASSSSIGAPGFPPSPFNPFMHPYFGKMDPTYLHFLANATPLFMPPPPQNFMAIPGAVEQFYKEFFMQNQGGVGGRGLPASFPPGFYPPSAGNNERERGGGSGGGSKS